jgi:hypothetical protein
METGLLVWNCGWSEAPTKVSAAYPEFQDEKQRVSKMETGSPGKVDKKSKKETGVSSQAT